MPAEVAMLEIEGLSVWYGQRRALENVKNFDSGILPPLTIGPDHETQKQGFWVRVEKGRFKPLTDWLRSD